MSEPNSIAIRKRGLNKRSLVLLLVVAAGLATIIWFLDGFRREPRYQDKPASYWLDQTDNPTENLKPSDEAFAKMGTEAVSFLARTLGGKPSWYVRKLSEFASNHQLPAWLERLFPNTRHLQFRRVMAAHYLAYLGPEAESALPTLWQILESPGEDWELRSAVRRALFSMGEKTALLMPEFVRCLKNGNAENRMTAAGLLGILGERGKPAVPALAEALLDPDPGIRGAVFDALAKLGTSQDDLTPLLGGLPQNSQMRAETLGHLSRFRSGGKKTAAALAEVFPVSSPAEQKQILYMLQRVGSQAGPAVPALIAALSNSGDEIRYLAVHVLAEIGPEAKAAIPVLKEQLKDENDMIKTAARNALEKINAEPNVDPAISE